MAVVEPSFLFGLLGRGVVGGLPEGGSGPTGEFDIDGGELHEFLRLAVFAGLSLDLIPSLNQKRKFRESQLLLELSLRSLVRRRAFGVLFNPAIRPIRNFPE
jgi:hypothetical protein